MKPFGIDDGIETINSLTPKVYDHISLSYTSGNLTGVVFALDGMTISTLTLSYDGSNNLTGVVKT